MTRREMFKQMEETFKQMYILFFRLRIKQTKKQK